MSEFNKDETSHLPELSKQRTTPEADITPKVLAWFEKHYPRSVAIEIKYGKNTAPLPHQRAALQKVASGSYSYKIPDRGGRNPFDAVFLKDADALLVHCKGTKCDVYDIHTNEFSFAFDI